MKKSQVSLLLCAGLLALAVGARAEDSGLRLGAGANYWTAVKNIDVDNIDKHGFSWVGTVQFWPSWIGVEADVEWFKSGYAGAAQDVWAPQAYLLLGKTLYGAIGIGGYYSDGDWADKPSTPSASAPTSKSSRTSIWTSTPTTASRTGPRSARPTSRVTRSRSAPPRA